MDATNNTTSNAAIVAATNLTNGADKTKGKFADSIRAFGKLENAGGKARFDMCNAFANAVRNAKETNYSASDVQIVIDLYLDGANKVLSDASMKTFKSQVSGFVHEKVLASVDLYSHLDAYMTANKSTYDKFQLACKLNTQAKKDSLKKPTAKDVAGILSGATNGATPTDTPKVQTPAEKAKAETAARVKPVKTLLKSAQAIKLTKSKRDAALAAALAAFIKAASEYVA